MVVYFENEDQREYYKRFISYLEENSREVNPKYDFWKEQVSFVCPACGKYYDEGFGGGYTTKKESIWHMYKCFSSHLFATIRLSGDLKHIQLLVKILGKRLSIIVLDYMAKKNILISMNIKKVIDKLKQRVAIQGDRE